MSEERRITKQYLLEHLNKNELDLGMTNLSKVPVKELLQIPRATKLDLSRNRLTSLPESISSLKNFLELDLSNNQLTELPDSFGELVQLERLDLYGNKLTELPLSFAGLERLHWLDLRNNPLNQGLANAAGTCVDGEECKQCAKNVMVYLKEAAAEVEKKKKKNKDRKLARERKKQEEERRKKEETKREKAELRRRRGEERERQQVENARELPDGQGEDAGTSTGDSEEAHSEGIQGTACGACCCCLCKLLPVLTALLIVLLVCSFLYCDSVFDSTLCKELHQTASGHLHTVLGLAGLPAPSS